MLKELPDELLAEQAYLVSCGVRHLAIVGECKDTEFERLAAMTRLDRVALQYDCMSFVVSRQSEVAGVVGLADCGYCRHSWAVRLLEWASSQTPDDLIRDSVLGLLCGYSSEAIAAFHERRSVRRLAESGSMWTEPVSK
jgi:hypothetical protein